MEHSRHQIVYKVCPSSDWATALQQKSYKGSTDDLRDGFIHFSTRTQLPATLARHFSDPATGRGRPGLLLVAIAASRLGPALKWEPARDGSLFPHLYGPLDPALAQSTLELEVGSDGRHVLPGDLD